MDMLLVLVMLHVMDMLLVLVIILLMVIRVLVMAPVIQRMPLRLDHVPVTRVVITKKELIAYVIFRSIILLAHVMYI